MFDKELIQKWVKSGIEKDTVDKAFQWGKELVEPNKKPFDQDALTTSQIRNVFGELRRIQLNGYKKEKTAFLLVKPKLAYAAKRHKKKGVDMFYKLFCDAYDAMDFKDDDKGEIHFENLMNLMEAVLAYHKYHGGKE
ncbi:MAG TPA: type III-A CRISPR-associated protein Csm2 [Bacteroidales bacterium]|nr:type III-A CRISPR-associated protein Csm2 [Bacteroidales bacterium]HQI45664.1 type III-A CRISPR-associated protein Csm2 [Bacteroidales bacterium]